MTLNKQAIKAALIVLLTKGLNGLLILAGVAASSYGAWRMYEPAGFMVLGAALIWMGLPEKPKAEPAK